MDKTKLKKQKLNKEKEHEHDFLPVSSFEEFENESNEAWLVLECSMCRKRKCILGYQSQ